MRSLLQLRYPQLEVIVINDGSTDGTLRELSDAFELRPRRRGLPRSTLADAAGAGDLRVAPATRTCVVVDKEQRRQGRRAERRHQRRALPVLLRDRRRRDARAPTRCCAWSSRIHRRPGPTVAAAASCASPTAARVEDGRLVRRRALPRNLLADAAGRRVPARLPGRPHRLVARCSALLIISGAFGLFRRDVVRRGRRLLTRHGRRGHGAGRAAAPPPARAAAALPRSRSCPTRCAGPRCPETSRTLVAPARPLAARPDRDARGAPRDAAATRATARIGMRRDAVLRRLRAARAADRAARVHAGPARVWRSGCSSVAFLLAFLVVAVLLGLLLSITALALEEFSFRRHPRGREILRMLRYARIENLGYRQLTDVWRGLAFWDLCAGSAPWGEMTRRGFSQPRVPRANCASRGAGTFRAANAGCGEKGLIWMRFSPHPRRRRSRLPPYLPPFAGLYGRPACGTATVVRQQDGLARRPCAAPRRSPAPRRAAACGRPRRRACRRRCRGRPGARISSTISPPSATRQQRPPSASAAHTQPSASSVPPSGANVERADALAELGRARDLGPHAVVGQRAVGADRERADARGDRLVDQQRAAVGRDQRRRSGSAGRRRRPSPCRPGRRARARSRPARRRPSGRSRSCRRRRGPRRRRPCR